MQEYFVVTELCREDLRDLVPDPRKLSDEDMKDIASRVQEGISDAFWAALEAAVEELD